MVKDKQKHLDNRRIQDTLSRKEMISMSVPYLKEKLRILDEYERKISAGEIRYDPGTTGVPESVARKNVLRTLAAIRRHLLANAKA